MGKQFDKLYRTTDKSILDPAFYNRRFQDVDNRIESLEDKGDVADQAIAELARFGLERIDAALAPNLQKIQDAASLGFLSASVADNFTMSFSLGTTAVPLLKDARQALFTPAPFLALVRRSAFASYAIAQTLAYNKTTGVLDIQIVAQYGPNAQFADVEVWAVAGSALAIQGGLTDVQTALAGAVAAKNAAQAAVGTSQTAASAAQAAQSKAETAAAQITQAANIAGAGGVRVTAADNAPSTLSAKLQVTAPLKSTIASPNGDAKYNLTVDAATQAAAGMIRLANAAEITAGTSADTAVSPANLKAAVAAVGVAGALLAYSARTSNTNIVNGDARKWLNLNGNFSQTFDTCANLGVNWFCYIKNDGLGDITLDPAGNELIDGLSSYKMYPGEVRLIQCDGTQMRSIIIQAFSYIVRFAGYRNWIRPPGYTHFDVTLGGGAGGGEGGGARSYNSGNIFGGTAGHGAAVVTRRFTALELTSQIGITTGTGGAGGFGREDQMAETYGNPGAKGGDSYFGNLLVAYGGRGGSRDNHYGASPLKNFNVGNVGIFGTGINSANADNEIVPPDEGGAGGGIGNNAENNLYYSFSGGRSMRGGHGGGAGGGFWVNYGWDLYSDQLRPGGSGGARFRSGGTEAVSGGGAVGGGTGWNTNGGNGAAGGDPFYWTVPGTGGGGGGAGTVTGGNGGNGGHCCGGGGGGAGFSVAGGRGGKGGDGACLIVGIL